MLKVNARGSIARKIISKHRQDLQRKVISLDAVKQGKTIADNMFNGVKLPEKFEGYDPLYAIYTYGQNLLSTFAEVFLTGYKETEKFNVIMDKAEDEYQPGYPPMSPITRSFYFFWQICDLSSQGAKKETPATIVVDFLKHTPGFDPSAIQLFEAMAASRNGVYLHQGSDDKNQRVLLKELITDKEYSVHVESGYQGEKGEVWICRLLSSPFKALPLDYAVVVTTPYVHKVNNSSSVSQWRQYQNYMAKTIVKTGISDPIQAYEHVMKYGLGSFYWLELIFEAYSDYDDQAVYIYGSPDQPRNFPHFHEQSAKACDLI